MSALTLWETKTKSDTGNRDEYKGIYVEESSEEKCAKELGDDPNHTRAMLRSIRFSKVRLQAQQRAERILRECKPYWVMGGSRCASCCPVHITSDCHGFISVFKNQSSLTPRLFTRVSSLDIRCFEKNCFRRIQILWYSYLMSKLSEGYRTYVIHHSGSKRIVRMVLVAVISCFFSGF